MILNSNSPRFVEMFRGFGRGYTAGAEASECPHSLQGRARRDSSPEEGEFRPNPEMFRGFGRGRTTGAEASECPHFLECRARQDSSPEEGESRPNPEEEDSWVTVARKNRNYIMSAEEVAARDAAFMAFSEEWETANLYWGRSPEQDWSEMQPPTAANNQVTARRRKKKQRNRRQSMNSHQQPMIAEQTYDACATDSTREEECVASTSSSSPVVEKSAECLPLEQHPHNIVEKLKFETLKKSFESLERISTCAICLLTARPNAVYCVNAHVICAECKGDLTKCPTCNQKFSDNRFGRFIREVLQAIPQRCKHKDCDEYLNDGDNHEQICVFREAVCEKCGWKGTVSSMIPHVKQPHCKHLNCGKYLSDEDDEHEKYCGLRLTKCEMLQCRWEGAVNELLNHIRTGHHISEFRVEAPSDFYWTHDLSNTGRSVSPRLAFDHLIWEEISLIPELNCVKFSYFWIPNGKPEKLYNRCEIISTAGEKEYACEIKIDSDPDRNLAMSEGLFYVPASILPKFIGEGDGFWYKSIINKTGHFGN